MRTLKYAILSLLAIVVTTAFTACGGKDNSDSDSSPEVIRSNDELKPSAQDVLTALQQLKITINEITNEINDGFDEITTLEQTIDTIDISQLSQNKRAKLRNDILLKKNAIQDRGKQLSDVEDDLSYIDEKNKTEIEQLINNLRKQLDLQKSMIDHLSSRLNPSGKKAKGNTNITDSTTVNNQPPETMPNTQEKDVDMKQREQLNNELNECYYVIGTREVLKNHKIIESEFLNKTKVMQSGNLLISYFTKADKRTLNEISIPGKNVKLLTTHDAQSFSKEENGDLTIIRILDPVAFWEYSNYLVVQVE